MKTTSKICAWINVAIRLLIVDLLFRVLALVIYPFVYLFRGPIRWLRKLPVIGWLFIPLWIFLDDTGDYGNQLECWSVINILPTTWWNKFRIAYYWSAIRNIAWNSYTFKFLRGVDNTKPTSDYHFSKGNVYSYLPDDLKKDGKPVPICITSTNARMNRAKFYYRKNGVKTQFSNDGTFLDLDHSFFGNSLYYFKNNGKWWVLRTHCRIRKIKSGVIKIREFNIGAVDSRILWRDKWQHARIE